MALTFIENFDDLALFYKSRLVVDFALCVYNISSKLSLILTECARIAEFRLFNADYLSNYGVDGGGVDGGYMLWHILYVNGNNLRASTFQSNAPNKYLMIINNLKANLFVSRGILVLMKIVYKI